MTFGNTSQLMLCMPNTLSISDEMPPRTEWDIVCSVKRALDVVGNRSTLLLLREAFYGTTRFDEFVRRVHLSEPVAAAGCAVSSMRGSSVAGAPGGGSADPNGVPIE